MIPVVWYLEGHWTGSGLIPYEISSVPKSSATGLAYAGQPAWLVEVLSMNCGLDPCCGSVLTYC